MTDVRHSFVGPDAPQLALFFDLPVPVGTTFEQREACDAEGRFLVEVLVRSLPTALLDGILIALLDYQRGASRRPPDRKEPQCP